MENNEDKLIIAKLNDKISFCKIRKTIVNTQFLNMHQEIIIRKELQKQKEKNYIITGGYEGAESKLLMIYPEKLTQEVAHNHINKIIKAIRIVLPNEQIGKYEHRDYLGTIMQFGLERDRIGDIIVHKEKAYILTISENAEYIKNSLQETKKFKKSKIDIIEISEIEIKKPEFEIFKISVNSLRLDNFISEIANISRSEATKLIQGELVSINGRIETKQAKIIEQGDILIIRGKGKYIINQSLNINKKGKQVIEIKKYK